MPACVGLARWGGADRPSEASRPTSGAWQFWLEESFHVIVPVGCAPKRPLSLASSLKVSPTVPAAGSWVVVIAGEAWPITTGSSAQPLAAGALPLSPAYVATQQ